MKLIIAVANVFLVAAVSAAPGQFGSRVVGGSDAKANQFPYQISLQMHRLQGQIQRHLCGGSVLNKNLVVTAGHCVTGDNARYIEFLVVKAGLLELTDTEEVQTIEVESVIVHPDYQFGINPNDIALLKLKSPLKFNDAVQRIGLPEAGSIPTGSAVLSGWGSISTTMDPEMPNILQTVTLPILLNDECNQAFTDLVGESELLTSTHVCTGPLTGGLGACTGDSGGPLAQNGTLIGIVSWGLIPCGYVGAPSVFTRVSAFVEFILQYS